MESIREDIRAVFGAKVRVRACGICIQNGQILLAGHHLYGENELFWSPPGGGIHFGESAEAALVREFWEETGLEVQVGKLLAVNEHIKLPLHAIELFFEITSFTGELTRGTDPELAEDSQILNEIRFVDWSELKALPSANIHRIFSEADSLGNIFSSFRYLPASSGL